MNKIDTSSWKEFKIGDLFMVSRPASRSQADYENGNVPFVASGNYNNGVLKYLQPKENEKLEKGNCITVSPVDGSSFYQKDDFLGRGGAGSSIILLYNDNLNLYNGYFIATVIRNVCSKYLYNNMGNKDSIKEEKIKLPVDDTGNPNWLYMEEYMTNLETRVSYSLTKLALAKYSSSKINVTTWKEFKIIDLFEVKNTHSILKSWVVENSGSTPYVTASQENNGVSMYVDYDKNVIEKGNSILIGGKTLVITYQEDDFYSNDSHNLALYLKEKKYQRKNIYLYLVTVLYSSLKNLYSWGDSISSKSIQKDIIKLPIKNDGNPDYEYMERFIEDIKAKELKRLCVLKELA